MINPAGDQGSVGSILLHSLKPEHSGTVSCVVYSSSRPASATQVQVQAARVDARLTVVAAPVDSPQCQEAKQLRPAPPELTTLPPAPLEPDSSGTHTSTSTSTSTDIHHSCKEIYLIVYFKQVKHKYSYIVLVHFLVI